MPSSGAMSPAPGLDVFVVEPPPDQTLVGLPQVVATPHIAASTVEAQELVGIETAMSVRDYLRDGAIRNAVNFPALPAEDQIRLRPYMTLADRLGALLVQIATGPHAWDRHPLLRRRGQRRLRSARERRGRRRAAADSVGRGDGDQRRARWRRSAGSRSSSRAARGRATSRTCSR